MKPPTPPHAGDAADPPVRDAPAFDFYPERWLVGVAGMSDAEQLAYLRLLCHQWLLGDAGLPEDVPALKRLGGSKGVTEAVLAKLPLQRDGKRRNARLEIIRAEQRERIASRRRGAAKTNAKRWPRAAAEGSLSDAGATRCTGGERCADDAGDGSPPPTAHLPPPTLVPEAIHPPAGARVRPTLEQARGIAPEIGITPDQAETWWLAREASQWLRSSNGALMPVGDNWRADARTFTQYALQRRPPPAGSRPAAARSDTANAPGRYA